MTLWPWTPWSYRHAPRSAVLRDESPSREMRLGPARCHRLGTTPRPGVKSVPILFVCQRWRGERSRAHQHTTGGRRRQPVRATSEVELDEAEAKTDHRAGAVRPGVVSLAAYVVSVP